MLFFRINSKILNCCTTFSPPLLPSLDSLNKRAFIAFIAKAIIIKTSRTQIRSTSRRLSKKVKEDVIFKMRLPFLNFPIRPYEGLPCPSKSLTYLTNREALTVLCCKARRKRLEHEKRLGGNTRRSRVFLPTSWVLFLGALLGCSLWVLLGALTQREIISPKSS